MSPIRTPSTGRTPRPPDCLLAEALRPPPRCPRAVAPYSCSEASSRAHAMVAVRSSPWVEAAPGAVLLDLGCATLQQPVGADGVPAGRVGEADADLREALPEVALVVGPRLPARLEHLVRGERPPLAHQAACHLDRLERGQCLLRYGLHAGRPVGQRPAQGVTGSLLARVAASSRSRVSVMPRVCTRSSEQSASRLTSPAASIPARARRHHGGPRSRARWGVPCGPVRSASSTGSTASTRDDGGKRNRAA